MAIFQLLLELREGRRVPYIDDAWLREPLHQIVALNKSAALLELIDALDVESGGPFQHKPHYA